MVWDCAPDEAVKVKPVVEVLEFPPFPAALMKFIDWVAAYTLSKKGDVLALGLKESLLAAPTKRGKKFAFGGADPALAGPDFSPAQAAAVAALRAAVGAKKFGVTLLDGVTGSGKTEVYLEAVAEVLQAGGQALVLLPEIALSVQFLQRFERRFGATAGGLAFGADAGGAAGDVAGGRRGARECGGGGALGAVPPLPCPWADRRR